MTIIKILKDEEKDVNDSLFGNDAINENLEYFLQTHILETLASYAITDEPRGFFKFMLGVIEDLLNSVK